jgi:eukaryotic-like serine/threonine-protein kinase
MPPQEETIAYCHSCGAAMDVSAVAPFTNVECPQCGKHTRVKREFGPYTLVRRHAIGGMSMVFAAHDNTLDREVALKILSEEFSADERRIAAFEEEARITASFSHPHVVRVLTTGRAFGRFYIAMELVPGGHFEHQIRERGKIPEAEMLPLAIEVAQGLKAAHAAGLIHRDVKPGNILLDAEGHAKLVDFGLALVTQGGKAQATELWATPYYVPPETVDGRPEDFRSDIYAFGATLYHALAGKPSCDQESMATDVLRDAKKRVVRLSAMEPSVSAETSRIVERAMAYEPKDRFSSYDEMITAMTRAISQLKSGRSESSAHAAKRRALKKRKEMVRLLTVSAVLIAGSAVAVFLLSRPKKDVGETVAAPVSAVPPPVVADTSADIARSYREARAAIEAREYEKAAAEFTVLLRNPQVQEPTRTWAGVEAVLAAFLDGRPTDGRKQARELAAHVSGLPKNAVRIGEGLTSMLGKLGGFEPLSPPAADKTDGGASLVISSMLAGLKNWEQGQLDRAADCFKSVIATKLPPDASWAVIYQKRAADYLADHQTLGSPVFSKLPADSKACDAATDELDSLLATLKTRGRARFNIRAWQLDITRHAKLLTGNGRPAVGSNPTVTATAPGLEAVMDKLADFSGEFRFVEASTYLKSLNSDPKGATRESLLALTESSVAFLADIEDDLLRSPVAAELPLRSGESASRVSINGDQSLSVTISGGASRSCSWKDFTPDAIIGLHRLLVKNPKSELERLRRHECAIAFEWLAGNRGRAISAAGVLAQGNATFKQRWDAISAGLPK